MPASDKTPESQLLVNVRGIIAEYERGKILERTMRGLRGRAQAGHVPGGAVPLGYRSVRSEKGGTYEIDPEEAALVHRIFQMYVQEGLSINAIAQQLTRARVPTHRDRRGIGPQRKLNAGVWHPASLHDLLTSETYMGTLYYGKRERTASPNNPDKKTAWRVKPKDEWIAIAVPPIIDEDTFHAAQRQRERNAQNSRRNRKHDYLFGNGRLRCAQCGCAMHGQCDVRYGRLYYRCTRPKYQTDSPCRGTVGAARLEKTVWEAVERVLRQPEIIAAEVQQRKHNVSTEQSDLDRERRIFEGQIAQCDKELRKWEQAYIADAIDVHDLKAKKAEVMARRASLEREIARVDEQQQLLEQVELETASLVEYCQRVRETLHRFDNEEKRLALDALNITVVWHPDKPLEIQGSILVSIASDAPRCRPRRAHDRCRRC